MDLRVRRVKEGLRSNGFAQLRGAVAPSIVDRMKLSARELASQPSSGWADATKWFTDAKWRPAHFAGKGRNTNLYDCLGLNASLDAAAEDLLATPVVRELLDGVLGPDYRMWYAQLRWAEPGGDEYVLHQDVYGECALCLYLDDHPDGAGSVAFWPGSHRWPRALESLPLLEPRWVNGRVTHVPGLTGDIAVFFNKTWHGRTSARDRRLVFLISFIPPGPIEKARRMPADVRARLGPQLQRVNNPDAGRSFGDTPSRDRPFSSTFEHPELVGPECTFADYPEAAIAEYACGWCRSELDRDAAEFSSSATLTQFKEIVRGWNAPRNFSVDRLIQCFEDRLARLEMQRVH